MTLVSAGNPISMSMINTERGAAREATLDMRTAASLFIFAYCS